MSLVVPDTIEVEVLNQALNPTFTLRLYGNDVTPSHTSSAASFTEISGGGYANKILTFPNWTIVSGEPSYGVYNNTQQFVFTGPPSAPGTIFGYYITRNTDGKLLCAERFGSGVVPFLAVVGSVIKVLPKFSVQSQF